MALQQKLVGQGLPSFIPYPLELTKVVRPKKRVEIISKQIPWATLSETEFDAQWSVCLNSVHMYENAGVLERKDFMPYFIAYMQLKKYSIEDISKVRNASEKYLTYGTVSKAFLLMTAEVDHPSCRNTDRFLTRKIKELLERNDDEAPALVDTRRTAAQRNTDKRSEFIGELLALEDDKGAFDLKEFLTERAVPKDYLLPVIDRFTRVRDELVELAKGKDAQLTEAYRHLSKAEVAGLLMWYEGFLETVADYMRGAPATQRKKKVFKPKPPEKVAARVKYMVRDEELGIDSVRPAKIVGAQQVFLYNTKTRQLQVYTASEHDKTLTVKGTTLLGWSKQTTHSYQKRLRWPEDQLQEFMGSRGSRSSLKILQDIKTKPVSLRGRIGEDILILKVY